MIDVNEEGFLTLEKEGRESRPRVGARQWAYVTSNSTTFKKGKKSTTRVALRLVGVGVAVAVVVVVMFK